MVEAFQKQASIMANDTIIQIYWHSAEWEKIFIHYTVNIQRGLISKIYKELKKKKKKEKLDSKVEYKSKQNSQKIKLNWLRNTGRDVQRCSISLTIRTIVTKTAGDTIP